MMMRIVIVAITEKGKKTGAMIKKSIPGSSLCIPTRLNEFTKKAFTEFDGIVFCMAAGIAARVIAPCIKDKYTDPAIVVVDEARRFAVSLLSGHEGGANSLAIRVANVLGAEPVITTASESHRKIVVGIGARRGIDKNEIIKAVRYAMDKAHVSTKDIRCIATIDLKQNEPGLREACMELELPLRIVSAELIKRFNGSYERSSFVKEKIGVEGVSEPCALITARKPKLILPKTIVGRVTVALAKEA
ncbi:MAG: cobalamin biosynthesis protein [Candidatus Omnitrophica bacterium]|nr:cobalamin biosynthesis protein [Candidatus Omnitrophota bacterium]